MGKGTSSKNKGHPLYRKKFPAEMPKNAMTQKDLKAMLPPDTSCWRGLLGSGAWYIHVKHHPRIARSWAHRGHYKAAMYVLRRAWEIYLEDYGLPLSDCPVPGLFRRSDQ